MPKGKPATPKTSGLRSPRTHCPITKELIRVVKVGDLWIGTTSLWTSRPYQTRDRLMYELSYNNGVAPSFPEPGVSVVRDANEPPDKYPVGAEEE